MKKFVQQVLVFSLFLLAYFVLMGLINYYIYTQQNCIVKEHTILIAGDSQTRRGINPELFDDAINISQPAEPYVITYWKLKKIFKSASPDTLIIGFGPHNLSAFNDFKFWEEKWSTNMFERNYPVQEFLKLKTFKIDYIKFFKVLWKQTCFFPKRDHCTYIGNYFNSNSTNFSDTEKVVKRHYYRAGKEVGISNTSISFLDSIIHICQSNGVTPVLVYHPVHKSYFNQIPKQNTAKYKEVKKKLITEGVTIIGEPVSPYPDSLFFNANHLNDKGATRFTKELIQILKTDK